MEFTDYRTHTYLIDMSDELYEMCLASKSLYNQALYLLRQHFFETDRTLSVSALDKLVKETNEYHYRKLYVQSAQATIINCRMNIVRYFKATKVFYEHWDASQKLPKFPMYLDKQDLYDVVLTNQLIKLVDGHIYFSKRLGLEPLKLKQVDGKLLEVRLKPIFYQEHDTRKRMVEAQVVFKKTLDVNDLNSKHVAGIDLGLHNIVTLVSTSTAPILISGDKMIRYQHQFNRKLARIFETGGAQSVRAQKLYYKRKQFMNTELHKITKTIINYCVDNDISTLVIGRNKTLKEDTYHRIFKQLPVHRIVEILEYKTKEYGITLHVTEESHTSGTSFLDDELPTPTYYDKSRRKHRGCFISNDGIRINADVNAAFQIIRKIFPNIEFDLQIKFRSLNPRVLKI